MASGKNMMSVVMALAAAGIAGVQVVAVGDDHSDFDDQPKPKRGPKVRAILTDVLPETNRHTGEPHKHSREIARRLRQQGRTPA